MQDRASGEGVELFEHLEIAKDATFEAHLNKYPVISFDVQEERSRVKDGMDFVPWMENAA